MNRFWILIFCFLVLSSKLSAKTLREIDSFSKDGGTTTGRFILTTPSGVILSFGSNGHPYRSSGQTGSSIYASMIRRSMDHGKTWSIVYQGKPGSLFFNVVLSERGSLFVTADSRAFGPTFLLASRDDGNTWAEVPIEKKCEDDSFRTILAQSNRLLLFGFCVPDPFKAIVIDGLEYYYEYRVFESLDDGQTWKIFSKLPEQKDGTTYEMSPILALNSKGDYFAADMYANLYRADSQKTDAWDVIHIRARNDYQRGLFVDHQDTLYSYYDKDSGASYLRVSHDSGQTWTILGASDILKESERNYPINFTIERLFQSSGDKVYMMVTMRESVVPRFKFKRWAALYSSQDHGITWSLEYSSRDQASLPGLTLFSVAKDSDGSLLLTGDTQSIDEEEIGVWKTFRLTE